MLSRNNFLVILEQAVPILLSLTAVHQLPKTFLEGNLSRSPSGSTIIRCFYWLLEMSFKELFVTGIKSESFRERGNVTDVSSK